MDSTDMTKPQPLSTFATVIVSTGKPLFYTKVRRPFCGLEKVTSAKSDGRWEAAYEGPSKMEIPDDFLQALTKNKVAEMMSRALNRTNLYRIYHRLHTAKKPQTRHNWMDKIIDRLARGEKFHWSLSQVHTRCLLNKSRICGRCCDMSAVVHRYHFFKNVKR